MADNATTLYQTVPLVSYRSTGDQWPRRFAVLKWGNNVNSSQIGPTSSTFGTSAVWRFHRGPYITICSSICNRVAYPICPFPVELNQLCVKIIQEYLRIRSVIVFIHVFFISTDYPPADTHKPNLAACTLPPTPQLLNDFFVRNKYQTKKTYEDVTVWRRQPVRAEYMYIYMSCRQA